MQWLWDVGCAIVKQVHRVGCMTQVPLSAAVLSMCARMYRCLMDTKPRKMTTEDYRVLNSCAEMV